jgi:hypothetical protein
MKRSLILPLLAIVLAFFSCKKSSDSGSTEITTPPDFVQLKVGNYWIYEFYRVDTNGVATKLASTDSAYIWKDTVINGIKYYLKIQDQWQFTDAGKALEYPDTAYLRDSLGYLIQYVPVNGKRFIQFSRDNFTDVLFRDTISALLIREQKMTGKDSTITVPAGSFTTRSLCLICYPLQPTYPWGIRRYYYSYGNGIGQVKYTYGFYGSPDHYEARLIRYRVN